MNGQPAAAEEFQKQFDLAVLLKDSSIIACCQITTGDDVILVFNGKQYQ